MRRICYYATEICDGIVNYFKPAWKPLERSQNFCSLQMICHSPQFFYLDCVKLSIQGIIMLFPTAIEQRYLIKSISCKQQTNLHLSEGDKQTKTCLK